MFFVVYAHIQYFLNLCRNKKKNQLRFKKCLHFKFLKHIYGELIHTNQNSFCLINNYLIILKVIPQSAHYTGNSLIVPVFLFHCVCLYISMHREY